MFEEEEEDEIEDDRENDFLGEDLGEEAEVEEPQPQLEAPPPDAEVPNLVLDGKRWTDGGVAYGFDSADSGKTQMRKPKMKRSNASKPSTTKPSASSKWFTQKCGKIKIFLPFHRKYVKSIYSIS